MIKKDLFQALKRGDWVSVDAIVSKSPNLLMEPILRKSLLNYAIEQGRLDQVQLLVERGIPIDFSDECTLPIASAIEKGKMDILKWLLEKGVDLKVPQGDKPLIYKAMHSGSKEMVELLIEYGVDLQCSWGIWDTPLANAMAGKRTEMVELLSEHTGLSEVDAGCLIVTAKGSYEKKLNEDDLRAVERKLNLKIPNLYRAFLADFPDDLVTDDDEGIFHSSDLIIESTQAARKYREDDWDDSFPCSLIAVGWNGGGSVYCIREGETGNQIYLFDHEQGCIDPTETMNLEEFAAMARSWLIDDRD